MTLIECPVCGRHISVEAEACPQYGEPNPNRQTTAARQGLGEFEVPAFDLLEPGVFTLGLDLAQDGRVEWRVGRSNYHRCSGSECLLSRIKLEF